MNIFIFEYLILQCQIIELFAFESANTFESKTFYELLSRIILIIGYYYFHE